MNAKPLPRSIPKSSLTLRPSPACTPQCRMTLTIVWPTVGLCAATPVATSFAARARPRCVADVQEQIIASPTISRHRAADPAARCSPTCLIPDRFSLWARDGPDDDRDSICNARGTKVPCIVGVLRTLHADRLLLHRWGRCAAYASQSLAKPLGVCREGVRCGMSRLDGATRGDAVEYDAGFRHSWADDDDLIGSVSRLESMADSGELDEDDDEPPIRTKSRGTTDRRQPTEQCRLMAEVERFLRDQGSGYSARLAAPHRRRCLEQVVLGCPSIAANAIGPHQFAPALPWQLVALEPPRRRFQRMPGEVAPGSVQ